MCVWVVGELSRLGCRLRAPPSLASQPVLPAASFLRCATSPPRLLRISCPALLSCFLHFPSSAPQALSTFHSSTVQILHVHAFNATGTAFTAMQQGGHAGCSGQASAGRAVRMVHWHRQAFSPSLPPFREESAAWLSHQHCPLGMPPCGSVLPAGAQPARTAHSSELPRAWPPCLP